ncbi:MAG: rod-binding protein [Asticcacaulis sp.]
MASVTPLTLDAASLSSATHREPKKIGTAFESMVVSEMLRPMFDSLSTDGMFGGGEGEDAFKSFYVDAIAAQMVKAGGLGVSDMVQKQLLSLQEVSA